MVKNMENKRISVTVDTETYQDLKHLSNVNGYSVSSIARRILREFVKKSKNVSNNITT
jgi:metal-responsive CopG/Arc/MetJ family transcriptional regulator